MRIPLLLQQLYKLLFGLLIFSAIITEIAVLVERGTFVPSNFFSYFTILTNMLAAIVLITSAVLLAPKKRGRIFSHVRGATTLYAAITGIVFSTLLANIEGATLTAVAWDNIVLHYIMPIVLIVDWVIIDRSLKISFKQSFIWLAFPLAYVIYTLLRGSVTGWYPYPFLNPATGGYTDILVVSAGITALATGLSYALTKIHK